MVMIYFANPKRWCKMLGEFKRIWLRDIVPTYHHISDYMGYYVTASPTGLVRRLFRRAYFVGDRVELLIFYKVVSEEIVKEDIFQLCVYEVHPDGHRINHEIIDKRNPQNTIKVTGGVISKAGIFAIYLGNTRTGYDSDKPLFTAEIVHRDRREYDIFMVFLGVFLAFICGILLWLLGFIQIVPFWKIWIP